MVIGIGIDLVEIERIKRIWRSYGQKFAERILHETEQAIFEQKDPILFLAGRFAAKEALSKALGTGFSGSINLKDFAVTSHPSGQPEARLYGAARETFEQLGGKNIFISITHSKEAAAAMAVIEK